MTKEKPFLKEIRVKSSKPYRAVFEQTSQPDINMSSPKEQGNFQDLIDSITCSHLAVCSMTRKLNALALAL